MIASIMRRISLKPCGLLLCVTLLAAANRVGAQVQAASPGDSLTIRRNIFQRLFKGIVLSTEQRADAERAIADADRQSWALMGADTREVWEKLAQIQAQRDSVLRNLLVTEADRARFEAHARSMRLPPRGS